MGAAQIVSRTAEEKMNWKLSNGIEITEDLKVIGEGEFAEFLVLALREKLVRFLVPPPGMVEVMPSNKNSFYLWLLEYTQRFGVDVIQVPEGVKLTADYPEEDLEVDPDVYY